MASHSQLWGKTSGAKRKVQGMQFCLGYEGLPRHACEMPTVWE